MNIWKRILWQYKFFESWAKVGAASVWKLCENQDKKILKTKKRKIIEYDGSKFFLQ